MQRIKNDVSGPVFVFQRERRDTERRTKDPMTAASLGRRLAQRVTLTAGCDAVSGGTVDILCDCGLVT